MATAPLDIAPADTATEETKAGDPMEGAYEGQAAEANADAGEPNPEVEPEAVTEPEPDPIAPPVSWDKDGREQFAALPREAQEYIARRETARDLEVRRAQSERGRIERETLTHRENLARDYAQRLQGYARQFDVPAPDIRLLQSGDPAHRDAYYAQDQEYRLAQHQRTELDRQMQAATQEAESAATEQERLALAEDDALLSATIPEWSDPSGRANLLAKLEPIGAELGYSRELMAQAGATDILALRTALNWKENSDRYRDLMKRKMVPVREAKRVVSQTGRVDAPGMAKAAAVGSLAQLYPNDVPKQGG